MFNLFFYQPIYNILLFLGSLAPAHDMGVAIIALTLVVRGALSPLSHKMLTTQKKLREIEPQLTAIREKHKNAEDQGRRIMEVYKQHNVNPFSGFAFFIIQIPLFFALYRVAQDNFAHAAEVAYSFVTPPDSFATVFLNMFPLSQPNIIFALVAGISFFIQAWLSIPPPAPADPKKEQSFMSDFTRGMAIQSRYVLPVIITLVSLKLSVAVVLYIITSNLFTIGHELYVRRAALQLATA